MPKDSHPPAFMFYVKDFSCDGVVEAMSTEAVGAYILLLCKAWYESPPGSIPNDDQVLARWARIDAMRWADCRAAVLAAFTLGNDGRFHQKRLRLEFDRQRERSDERAEAGKRGAEVRWHSHSNRIAKPMAKDGFPSAFAIPNNGPGKKGEGGGTDGTDFGKLVKAQATSILNGDLSQFLRETVGFDAKQVGKFSRRADLSLAVVRPMWDSIASDPTVENPIGVLYSRLNSKSFARK